MSGGSETKCRAFNNANINHPLLQCTSFRMTLKCFFNKNSMSPGINVNSVSLEMPQPIGIVDGKVALQGRGRGLLEGICCIGDGDKKAFGGSDGKEEVHAWLLNSTGGVGLRRLALPGSRVLRGVVAGLTLAFTIRLHQVTPLDAKNIGRGPIG